MFDVMIVGGGPGAVAAGIYAARKKMNAALITLSFGGQSLVSEEIQNWIGVKSISGYDLAQALEGHLRAQEGITVIMGEFVTKIEQQTSPHVFFRLFTQSGGVYDTKTILLATGSRRKKLDVPGEKEFEGKGVVYCATCDAPLFGEKDVVVVGGGNAGLEAVIDLLPYARHITLLHRGETLKGDAVTQEKIRTHEKVTIIVNAEILRIEGQSSVEKIWYRDKETQKEFPVTVQGVFVEIGIVPNSELVKDFVALNAGGEVIVDHTTQKTSVRGIWAVGDVTDVRYKQNNISAGDAIKGILNIYDFFRSQ